MTDPTRASGGYTPDPTNPLDVLRALFAEFRQLDRAAPLPGKHYTGHEDRQLSLMRGAADLFADLDRRGWFQEPTDWPAFARKLLAAHKDGPEGDAAREQLRRDIDADLGLPERKD